MKNIINPKIFMKGLHKFERKKLICIYNIYHKKKDYFNIKTKVPKFYVLTC